MTKNAVLSLLLVAFLFGCSKEVEVTVVSEEPADKVVNQMSIHLFDLPEGITEAEYLADVAKLNAFYTAASYPENYIVLKVADDSGVDTYQYALVSSYESTEQYAELHDLGVEYQAYMDTLRSKHKEILDTEIYRKVFRLNTP